MTYPVLTIFLCAFYPAYRPLHWLVLQNNPFTADISAGWIHHGTLVAQERIKHLSFYITRMAELWVRPVPLVPLSSGGRKGQRGQWLPPHRCAFRHRVCPSVTSGVLLLSTGVFIDGPDFPPFCPSNTINLSHLPHRSTPKHLYSRIHPSTSTSQQSKCLHGTGTATTVVTADTTSVFILHASSVDTFDAPAARLNSPTRSSTTFRCAARRTKDLRTTVIFSRPCLRCCSLRC